MRPLHLEFVLLEHSKEALGTVQASPDPSVDRKASLWKNEPAKSRSWAPAYYCSGAKKWSLRLNMLRADLFESSLNFSYFRLIWNILSLTDFFSLWTYHLFYMISQDKLFEITFKTEIFNCFKESVIDVNVRKRVIRVPNAFIHLKWKSWRKCKLN